MKTCPKSPRLNIAYRRELVLAAEESDEFKDAIWQRCAQDPVFFCNSFLWTFSPKDFPSAPNRPFVLWDFQEEIFLKINESIGKHDLVIEKSRDMGASWLCAVVFLWRWLFFDKQTFLIGSRKQELVDRTGDPRSLFWKIDYALDLLPGWMVPRYTRTSMHILNEENGSTIDGESTNDDFARGDRRTAILLDEFPAVIDNGHKILAATRDATACRIFNGTPQGSSGAYYETRQNYMENQPSWVLRMHWTQHPLKSKGLYRTQDGPKTKIVILDKKHKFPPNYHFIDDGKHRSPWYDDQCVRAAHPQEIAQELDIDYAASGYQFFDAKILDDLVREMAREPIYRGDLAYESDGSSPQFTVDPNGRLAIWIPLDGHGRPTPSEYWIACDVATGKGGKMSSNSVASVGDRRTGHKVAQFTFNAIAPQDFGVYAMALCHLFKDIEGNPGMLIWEENGPGMEFSKRVKEDGFRRLFMREAETDFYRKKTQKAGWYSNAETKRILLSNYKEALVRKEFWNPCKEALRECSEYVHRNGKIEHSKVAGAIDPTEQGENHGDMVIADALCFRGMTDRGSVDSQKTTDERLACPPGSYSYRRREYEKTLKKTNKY